MIYKYRHLFPLVALVGAYVVLALVFIAFLRWPVLLGEKVSVSTSRVQKQGRVQTYISGKNGEQDGTTVEKEVPLKEALALTSPVVLVPKAMPAGAELIGAYKTNGKGIKQAIILKYKLNEGWIEIWSNALEPDQKPTDYEKFAKSANFRIRGGAPTGAPGMFQTLQVRGATGMGCSADTNATNDDKKLDIREQRGIGAVTWFNNGTEYWATGYGMSVEQLLPIAESME